MTDVGPWNDFAPQAPSAEPDGPWKDFAAPAATPPPPDQIQIDEPTRQILKPKLGPVLGAFTSNFKEGWGPEDMGISDENTKKLQELGFFRTMKDDKWNVGKAAWEMLLDGGVRTAETLIRGGTGLFRGAQGAISEALTSATGEPTSFGREMAALPEAFLGTPHPLGVPKEFVKPSPIEPILHDEAPAPASVRPRAELARTGDPVTDGILNDPIVSGVINRAVIDRAHTIPYEAGGSMPPENPATYVDKHVPQTFTVPRVSDPTKTVTIDTGEPAAIHENIEMAVEQKLRAGGMTSDEAYRVAHFDFAQMAEHAWYAANDVDPEAVEAEWQKLRPGIQHEIANDTPPDLYVKEYPGADVTKARHEELFERPPTAEESLRGREIMKQALADEATKATQPAGPPQLVMARRMPDGTIKYGKPGQVHSDLMTRAELADNAPPIPDEQMGFAKPGGEFMSRQEALRYAQEHEPARAAYSSQQPQFGLEGATYNEATQPKIPDLAEARDLGVIGPEEGEKPQIESVKDVDRVMAARRAPGDKVTQEVGGGKPVDPWLERWKKTTSKLDKPLDVQRIIRDPVLTDPDKFAAARRGNIPLADLNELARAAGVDAALVDSRVIGAAMKNDEQVRLGVKVLMQTAEDVKSAAQEHVSSPSDTTRIALQETIMRRDIALEQVLGFRGEWGRTGNVFQEFMKNVKDQEQLSEFLAKKGRTPADLDEIAGHINNLTPVQAAKYLSSAREMKPTGLLHWLWTQSLISGPFTHAKYVLANALYTTTERSVTPAIAAVIGILAGSKDRVLFGEAFMGAAGLGSSAAKGIVVGMKSWATGTRIGLRSEIEAYDIYKKRYDAAVEAKIPIPKEIVAGMKKLENAVSQIAPFQEPALISKGREGLRDLGERVGGSWGRVTADTFGNLATPGNMAMGIHAAFKYMGENAARESRAYRNTVAEGLQPWTRDFWDRWEHNVDNQSLEDLLGNIGDAYKGTFMQELGAQGKIWSKWTKEQKVARWVFPFSHIPINLAKASYEHTPFAYADGEMRAAIKGEKGERERDLAIARVVLGSGVMAYMGNLALNGLSTGDYPRDPQERKRWKQNGIQPNSVQIGGWWTSLNKTGPVGTLAGAAADFAQVAHIIGSDDEDKAMKAIWQMTNASINIVKNEVGFLSVGMFLDAMSEEKKGVKWAANQIGSLIPMSSLVGQTAAARDPDLREVKTFTDALKYKIPGLRETLRPERDIFGAPKINPAYGGNPFFGTLRASPVATDKVLLEMERLGLHPGTPQNRIGGVQLPPALYDKYLATRGTLTREHIEAFMRQPGWETSSDGARTELIKGAFKQAGEQARGMIQVERPDLITQGVDNKKAIYDGKKPVKKLPEQVTP